MTCFIRARYTLMERGMPCAGLFDFIRDKAGKWHEVYTSGEDGPTDRP